MVATFNSIEWILSNEVKELLRKLSELSIPLNGF